MKTNRLCKYVAMVAVMLSGRILMAMTPANQALYDEINDDWQAKNYAAIKSIIDTRLQANSSDLLALGLKQFYYVFAEVDTAKAKQAANAILAQTNASSNEDVQAMGIVLTEKVLNGPSSTTPYTATQKQKIHELMPGYPMIDRCFVLWSQVTGQPL